MSVVLVDMTDKHFYRAQSRTEEENNRDTDTNEGLPSEDMISKQLRVGQDGQRLGHGHGDGQEPYMGDQSCLSVQKNRIPEKLANDLKAGSDSELGDDGTYVLQTALGETKAIHEHHESSGREGVPIVGPVASEELANPASNMAIFNALEHQISLAIRGDSCRHDFEENLTIWSDAGRLMDIATVFKDPGSPIGLISDLLAKQYGLFDDNRTIKACENSADVPRLKCANGQPLGFLGIRFLRFSFTRSDQKSQPGIAVLQVIPHSQCKMRPIVFGRDVLCIDGELLNRPCASVPAECPHRHGQTQLNIRSLVSGSVL